MSHFFLSLFRFLSLSLSAKSPSILRSPSIVFDFLRFKANGMFFLHLDEILFVSRPDSAYFRWDLAGRDDWSPRVRVKSVAVIEIEADFRWNRWLKGDEKGLRRRNPPSQVRNLEP